MLRRCVLPWKHNVIASQSLLESRFILVFRVTRSLAKRLQTLAGLGNKLFKWR